MHRKVKSRPRSHPSHPSSRCAESKAQRPAVEQRRGATLGRAATQGSPRAPSCSGRCPRGLPVSGYPQDRCSHPALSRWLSDPSPGLCTRHPFLPTPFALHTLPLNPTKAALLPKPPVPINPSDPTRGFTDPVRAVTPSLLLPRRTAQRYRTRWGGCLCPMPRNGPQLRRVLSRDPLLTARQLAHGELLHPSSSRLLCQARQSTLQGATS